jgi:hypothetical protein
MRLPGIECALHFVETGIFRILSEESLLDVNLDSGSVDLSVPDHCIVRSRQKKPRNLLFDFWALAHFLHWSTNDDNGTSLQILGNSGTKS